MSAVSDLIKSRKKTIIAGMEPAQIYTLGVVDQDGALWDMLDYIQKCSLEGHSISFKIDDRMFGFDGDGNDKIITLEKKDGAASR